MLGVVVEIDGETVVDATWLRRGERGHIKMAELDAVLKGTNLVIPWKVETVRLMADSHESVMRVVASERVAQNASHHWLSDAFCGKARVKTKAAGEMLIRRELETIKKHDGRVPS